MAANYTISNIEQISKEYRDFINNYEATASFLGQVISTGTVLYNDPNGQSIFPNSWGGFQQYLLALNASIQAFIASLPARPSLNG